MTVAPSVMTLMDDERPSCPPGHARVLVEAVGLCGSDYHLFAGDHPYARFPQTQGHEFSGVIAEFGDGYHGSMSVGQRVAVEPVVACGSCYPCRRGRYNCCTELRVMGAHIPGALAEEVVVRVEALHDVGPLSAELAALVEPISVGLQAVRRASVGPSDQVVIYGAGPIGLAAAIASRAAGARVLVADRVSSRLDRALVFGAEVVIDTNTTSVSSEVESWTAGDGAAVVVEATGAPALIREAFDVVAASGTIVVVGISEHEVSIPVIAFSRKEVSMLGSRNSTALFPDAVAIVQNYGDIVGSLVSHRFTFEDAPRAIEFARSHPDVVEKVLIQVGGGE